MTIFRSSRPEVFLEKAVPKICSKFTGEHSCWSTISIKLQNFKNKNFRVLKFCLCELCFKSKWGSSERNASKFQVLQKQYWKNMSMLLQNKPVFLFCKFFKLLLHPLSLVTYNREYCKWLCRLWRHIKLADWQIRTLG